MKSHTTTHVHSHQDGHTHTHTQTRIISGYIFSAVVQHVDFYAICCGLQANCGQTVPLLLPLLLLLMLLVLLLLWLLLVIFMHAYK